MDITHHTVQNTFEEIFEGIKNFIEQSLDYLISNNFIDERRTAGLFITSCLILATTYTILHYSYRGREQRIDLNSIEDMLRRVNLQIENYNNLRTLNPLRLEDNTGRHRAPNQRIGFTLITIPHDRNYYMILEDHLVNFHFQSLNERLRHNLDLQEIMPNIQVLPNRNLTDTEQQEETSEQEIPRNISD